MTESYIEPPTSAIIRDKYVWRRFFLIGILIVLLCYLLSVDCKMLWAGNYFADAFTEFFSTFAAALGVLIFTYAIWLYVTPEDLRNAYIRAVQSVEISSYATGLLKGAEYYWFHGRSGSYFRSQVLPTLDYQAKKNRKRIHIKAVLPEPTSRNSNLYKNIKSGLDEEASPDTLAANVLATIIQVMHITSNNQHLTVAISLCHALPVLRYDVSDVGALITRDAISLPAIYCNSSNSLYDTFVDHVENELQQGRKIIWDSSENWNDLRRKNKDEWKRKIKSLLEVSDTVIEMAEECLPKPQSRYFKSLPKL